MLLPAHMSNAPKKSPIAVTTKAKKGVFSLLIMVTFMPNIEEAKLIGKNIKAMIVTVEY
jgi:hypothetical protein